MEWIAAVAEIWLSTLAWLAGLAVAFFLLTRLTPCNPGMYWWRNLRAAATDALYWLVVPLFLRLCRTLMLIAGVALLCGGREPNFLPVKGLPLWQQCVLVLLIQDVFLYAMHRAFHTGWAWKFHAVHHSPRDLDWVATQRFHPLNNLLTFCLADAAVLLLGFAPETLLILTPSPPRRTPPRRIRPRRRPPPTRQTRRTRSISNTGSPRTRRRFGS